MIACTAAVSAQRMRRSLGPSSVCICTSSESCAPGALVRWSDGSHLRMTFKGNALSSCQGQQGEAGCVVRLLPRLRWQGWRPCTQPASPCLYLELWRRQHEALQARPQPSRLLATIGRHKHNCMFHGDDWRDGNRSGRAQVTA